MKKKVKSWSKYDSPVNAYIVQAKHIARNRYPSRKYWVESDAQGYRICHSSFDVSRQVWCKAQNGKFYLFAAFGVHNGELFKIYVHHNLHASYIEEYLENNSFTEHQEVILDVLKHHQQKVLNEQTSK